MIDLEGLLPSTRKVQSWSERLELQEESWDQFRPIIFDEFLKLSHLPENCVSIIILVYFVRCYL